MTYLKKQNNAILFLLAVSVTWNVVMMSWLMRLTNAIENFEPVVVEYIQQVEEPEPTVETEPVEETIPEPMEPTVETVPEPQVTIDCPLDNDTQLMIYEKCVEYGLDFPFVMSVIYRESSFRPNADSGSSVGLMQINRINHGWLSEKLGLTDFFDPEQNVTAGTYMLKDLFDKYQNPRLVLMAYNMGETGARNMWNQGVYSTDYAEGILQLADKYEKQIEERMGEK